MTPIPEPDEVLPCGCRVGTVVIKGANTFVIRPCAPDCEVYEYVLSQTARQGKPLEVRIQ